MLRLAALLAATAAAQQRTILIFLGPPNAGKGTSAPIISEKLQIPQISTGDLMRNLDTTSEKELFPGANLTGVELKAIMDAGKFPDDKFVVKLVFDRVKDDDCKKGYILDGFPRTAKQAEILNELLKEKGEEVTGVVQWHVHDTIAAQRAVGRYIHKTSGASYNVLTSENARPKCLADDYACLKKNNMMLDDVTKEPLMRLGAGQSDGSEFDHLAHLHYWTTRPMKQSESKIKMHMIDASLQREAVLEQAGKIANELGAAAAKRNMVIAVAGPRLSGKSTVAAELARKLDGTYLDGPFGAFVEAGKKVDGHRKVITDAVMLTFGGLTNAEAREVAEFRGNGRWIHQASGRIYHTTEYPPNSLLNKADDESATDEDPRQSALRGGQPKRRRGETKLGEIMKDNNGDVLTHRGDDNHASMKKRLSGYHSQTAPIVELYKGKVKVVKGVQPIKKVQQDVENAIKALQEQQAAKAA